MAFEKKEGQGSLFFNEKKSEKHPDLKGYVIINQVEYEIAAWAGREGSKVAYSLKAQLKQERRDAAPEQSISQRAMPRREDPISSGLQKRSIIPDDMGGDDIPF